MLLPGPDLHCAGPWHVEDFRRLSVDQNKVLPFERKAFGTMPYGKSRPGYCITFLKRLDKSPR